jgi:hypothetical protein
VTVTPKLHQRCLAAARRHTSVHLHVGEFTSAVDRCGEYSVRCVQDADPGASPESALRSHGISAKALAGAELTVRITEAWLRMLPYGLPLPEQPACCAFLVACRHMEPSVRCHPRQIQCSWLDSRPRWAVGRWLIKISGVSTIFMA